MIFFSYVFFIVLIPLGLLKFIFNFNHLLVSLLTLEFISLVFFLSFMSGFMVFNLEGAYMLYFLVMIVCEGVLGLCLMVLMSFSYGSDYLFTYNKLSC